MLGVLAVQNFNGSVMFNMIERVLILKSSY